MTEKLSIYVLTYNSAKTLANVLLPLKLLADDLVVIDSGSTDATVEIARQYEARIIFNKFRTYKDQRNFAHQACTYKWVLAIDSDEVVSNDFIEEVMALKQHGFTYDAYTIARYWIVQGVQVHGVFPVESPDFPVRLVDKTKAYFGDNSGVVHESVEGYSTLGKIKAPVYHYTFETAEEIQRKLHQYTYLQAVNFASNPKTKRWYFPFTAYYRLVFSPPLAWYKWYIGRKGYKDGKVGRILSKYAFQCTHYKYKYFIKHHLFKKQ